MVDMSPPDPCSAPAGMSENPATVEEAVAWINAMEKPLELPCFVASLHRPLSISATKSIVSLQPAAGERSPRLFFLDDPLIMSITMDGDASTLLEFGQLVDSQDSIKAEIEFPVTRALEPPDPYTRIMYDETITTCGFCHAGERELPDDRGLGRVFVSRALKPAEWELTSLRSARAEHLSCDAEVEPYRCELFEAVFEHGEVSEGFFPEDMLTIFDPR